MLTQILIVVGAILIFVGVTILNVKTKKPEGCEDDTKSCDNCSNLACNLRKDNDK